MVLAVEENAVALYEFLL